MKLPSLILIFNEAKRSLIRFPTVLGFSLCASILAIVYINGYEGNTQIIRALLTCLLGIPLSFCWVMVSESNLHLRKKALSYLIGALFLGAFFISL